MAVVLMPLLAGMPTTVVAILLFLAIAFVPVLVMVLLFAFFRSAARRVGYPGDPPAPVERTPRLRGPRCWSVDSRP